jgi:hypothetical protein
LNPNRTTGTGCNAVFSESAVDERLYRFTKAGDTTRARGSADLLLTSSCHDVAPVSPIVEDGL